MTPVFQSGWEWVTPMRDLCLGAMCRQKWLRGQMLRSLAGVKTGLFASEPVPEPMVQ